MAGGTLYYRGAFTTWDALLRFPEAPDSLRGEGAVLSLIPWKEEELLAASGRAQPPHSRPAARHQGARAPGLSFSPPKTYHALSYLNPLQFWLPFPLIRINAADREAGSAAFLSIDGAGIYSLMRDPAQMNSISLSAAFDARSLMGVYDIQWTNTYLGIPVSFRFQDDIDKSATVWAEPVRITGFGLSAAPTHDIRSGLRFSLLPSLGIHLAAPDTGGASSAYTWSYEDPRSGFSLGMGLSTLSRFSWEVFGSGLSLALYGRYAVPFPFRFEATLQAAFEPLVPLRFRLYGIWDEHTLNLAGTSKLYTSSDAGDLCPAEYNSIAYALKWLAGGEAEAKLFSFEIQRALGQGYFNRIFSALAYRGGFYEYGGGEHPAAGEPLWEQYRLTQSLILRLGLTFSAFLLPMFPEQLTLSVEGILKISHLFDQDGAKDYGIGIYLNGLRF
ncbi:MAG: hypothetical protein LBC51_09220 [Treponema sp.]|jgi:hypothetical protein|nr:hypothetical protein [Treponema sp.]